MTKRLVEKQRKIVCWRAWHIWKIGISEKNMCNAQRSKYGLCSYDGNWHNKTCSIREFFCCSCDAILCFF